MHGVHVCTIEADTKGKTVTILAGVHGNELCGVRAINQILTSLHLHSGKVHFLFGNPRALEENVRFIDANLNRLFKPEEALTDEEKKSYEYKRACEIKPYLDESYASLDLHSSASAKTKPFVICEPQSLFLAKEFPVEIISHGWDALEPGGTDYYMNQKGKYGLCVECGSHDDPCAETVAVESIKAFLASVGILLKEKRSKKDQRIVTAEKIYITNKNFTPEREFADFEHVSAGALIGHDGSEPVRMEADGVVIFVRTRTKSHEEAFIVGSEV